MCDFSQNIKSLDEQAEKEEINKEEKKKANFNTTEKFLLNQRRFV